MSPRIKYLDSSRGIAALIVFFSHFQLIFLPQFSGSWLSFTPVKFLFDGEAAVLYFFILSGYVLTKSLQKLDSLSLQGYIQFIVRRVLRIYPAFLISLLLYFLIIPHLAIPSGWAYAYWKFGQDTINMLKQALLLVRIPNDPGLRWLPHDWTLSIEISLSFLLPLLALSFRRSPVIILITIYSCIKFLRLDPFVFDFALGVFIASSEKKLLTFASRVNMGLIIALAAILICGGYLIPNFGKYADHLLIHHKSLGLSLLLIFILSNQSVQRNLNRISLFGKISYSFYLIHLLMLLLFFNIFSSGILIFITSILSTILLSYIFFLFIEKPFIKIGHKLTF